MKTINYFRIHFIDIKINICRTFVFYVRYFLIMQQGALQYRQVVDAKRAKEATELT